MNLTLETLVIGGVTGLTYGLLGVGLVLVYRASKTINFAYAQIGAVGATVLAKLVVDAGWNWYVALALVTVLGGAIGGIIEVTVIRPLAKASRLVLFVATIAVFQVMLAVQLLLPGFDNPARYPTGLDRSMTIGTVVLRGEHFMALALIPAIVAALAILLQRTPYGTAIVAAADNRDGAELAGISTRRVSTQVWVLTGALVTISAVLVSPLQGVTLGAQTFGSGPQLLLRALAAGLVGRLTSLPRTLIGGLVLGIGEAVIISNASSSANVDAFLLVAVLALVLTLGRTDAAGGDGGWLLVGRGARQLVPASPRFVSLRRRAVLVAAAAAVVLPVLRPDASDVFQFSLVAVYAIVALSVTVLTGWAGQLSLGQFGLVGVGAVTTAYLVGRGMPFEIALLEASLVGAGVALLIGAPALRIRGYFLAITTLAFAIAARGWLFTRPSLLGSQSSTFSVPRGHVWFIDLDSERAYYYLCLAVLVGCLLAITRLRRTGIGRRFVAVQDNERGAAALTVGPAATKLLAFGVAGALAGLAGGLLAGLYVQFPPAAFEADQSLVIVSISIIGGLGSTLGAVLGAVYVVGLPILLEPLLRSVIEAAPLRLLVSGVGLLLLLLQAPGGLVELFGRAGGRLRALVRVPDAGDGTPGVATLSPVAPEPATTAAGAVHEGVVLRLDAVSVAFGGVQALRGVSLEVQRGEVLGLIGPNGAGKSTLIDAVCGFNTIDAGTISVFGRDLAGLPPHHRAHVIGRTFQNAQLFDDLTVREVVELALEVQERSELVPSLLGLPPSRASEWRKTEEALRHLEVFGLAARAETPVSELSTGTRRIVELVILLARGAQLVLMDEPTAGLSQRETEAFAPLIQILRERLGATIVIVEHDMPLLMSICDRVCCLAAGEVVAVGDPAAVRSDPAVIGAYLGTDERSINRSGEVVAIPARRADRPLADEVLLGVEAMDVSYGALQVLFDVNLEVGRGEVLALLGTNGAGKSTVLRAVSGLLPLQGGRVQHAGLDITLMPAAARARRGIVQVVGGKGVFPQLSVMDNLLAGAHTFIFDHARVRARFSAALASFPELVPRLDVPAGTLSGGEQQMLAVAKAMLLEPDLLLIDELSLGLAPIVVERLARSIESLRDEGVTIVVVEQSLNVALAIADRAVFLEKGTVHFDGPAADLLARDDLARAVFLGGLELTTRDAVAP